MQHIASIAQLLNDQASYINPEEDYEIKTLSKLSYTSNRVRETLSINS